MRRQPWGPRSEPEVGWLDEKCVCPLHPLVQLALSWRVAGGRRGEAAGGAAEVPGEGAGEPGAAVDDVINEQGVLRKEGRVDPRLHHDVAPDPLAYPLNDGVMSRDSLLELQRPWPRCAAVWRERYFDSGQGPRRLGVLCCVEAISDDVNPAGSGPPGASLRRPDRDFLHPAEGI